jgi:hypothetical protein
MNGTSVDASLSPCQRRRNRTRDPDLAENAKAPSHRPGADIPFVVRTVRYRSGDGMPGLGVGLNGLGGMLPNPPDCGKLGPLLATGGNGVVNPPAPGVDDPLMAKLVDAFGDTEPKPFGLVGGVGVLRLFGTADEGADGLNVLPLLAPGPDGAGRLLTLPPTPDV